MQLQREDRLNADREPSPLPLTSAAKVAHGLLRTGNGLIGSSRRSHTATPAGHPGTSGFKMKHQASRELYAYWNGLRGSRAAPERRDIDPAAIRSLLADTLIIEVERRGPNRMTFPVRLSGTRVNALFGAELKGRSLTTLWRLQDRREIAALAALVMDEAQPVVAGAVTGPSGGKPVNLELLLLPLRFSGRTHARLLGALSCSVIPPWLGLVPAAPLTLGSHRVIDVEPAQVAVARPRERSYYSGGTRYGQFVIYEGGRI